MRREFLLEAGDDTMKSPDYFGEVALIDEGTRMATICASSEVVCYGLTCRDFRALVEKNGVVGWKLLQRMVKMLRDTRKEAPNSKMSSARCGASTTRIRVRLPSAAANHEGRMSALGRLRTSRSD